MLNYICYIVLKELQQKEEKEWKYNFLQRNCIFFFYLERSIPFGVTRKVLGPIPAANRQKQGTPAVSPAQSTIPSVGGLVNCSRVPQWYSVHVRHHPLLQEQWGQKRYHRPLTTTHNKIEFSIIKWSFLIHTRYATSQLFIRDRTLMDSKGFQTINHFGLHWQLFLRLFPNHGPIKSSLECWRGRGGDKLIASN